MSTETITTTPISLEPDEQAPVTEPDTTPVQLELPDIQRLIREAIADVIAAKPDSQIPAGGNTPYLLDADALPTSEKIRRGLAMRDGRM